MYSAEMCGYVVTTGGSTYTMQAVGWEKHGSFTAVYL